MASKKVYIGDDKRAYMPMTKWVKIEDKMVTSRSWMWDYADSYSKEDGRRRVNSFRVGSRIMCMEMFMRTTAPIFIYDDSKDIVGVIGGYDSTAGLDSQPYMLEVHPDGECVRVWMDVGSIATKDDTEGLFEKCRKNSWKIANYSVACGKCPFANGDCCLFECGK